MKRILVLAVVAFAGVFAAGSAVQADHYRSVGHYGGGCGNGGYQSNYRGYGEYGGQYGVPLYGHGGGYRGGYGVSNYGYGVPSYGHGGHSYGHSGYGSGFSIRTQGLQFNYHR